MAGTLKITRDLLVQASDLSNNGITISDARKQDQPLIYVNAGFERMTGYTAAELLGKNCHFLQGTDTGQPEISTLREALERGKDCRVTLRNYRKNGSMFWNELSLTAVTNEQGELTHFIGIQQDVTTHIMLEQYMHQSHLDSQSVKRQTHTLSHTDPLVGISNRSHFDEQLASMLQTAQRTRSPLSVLRVVPDSFKSFRTKYGQQAGDACLRMVGERIARIYARASDCVARYADNEFAVASLGASVEGLQQHAEKLREQIRALNIPHHDSSEGVVTVCIGGITLVPLHDTTTSALLEQANNALTKAQGSGNNREEFV